MIISERLKDYIESLDTELPEFLREMEKKAIRDNIPIIRKDSESLLAFLITVKKPVSILEIGTAVGFSGCLMAEYMPDNCSLTTIEKSEKMLEKANENFKKSRRSADITQLSGDAETVLSDLLDENKKFDFVFMDAAKAQYMTYLKLVLPMLKKDGIIVTDNVLQEGSLIDSKFVIDRRDRTIHMRMREYLYEIKHNPALLTSIVCVGDGMALSVKIGD